MRFRAQLLLRICVGDSFRNQEWSETIVLSMNILHVWRSPDCRRYHDDFETPLPRVRNINMQCTIAGRFLSLSLSYRPTNSRYFCLVESIVIRRRWEWAVVATLHIDAWRILKPVNVYTHLPTDPGCWQPLARMTLSLDKQLLVPILSFRLCYS